MHRVLIPPEAICGDHITLDDAVTVHHLLRVVRVKVGEPLECFDGSGRVYRGPILQCKHQALTVAIETRTTVPPPHPALVLAQALIQPQRFDWVIQKATELGVTRVIPLVTSRTTIRPTPHGDGQQLRRWRRIAQEATAQCRRATLPTIEEPQRFESLLKWLTARDVLMPTLVEGGASIQEFLGQRNWRDEIIVLIGPEGDFSPEEVVLAKRAGVRMVSLGHATLRSETAAIVTLAILQHALGVL